MKHNICNILCYFALFAIDKVTNVQLLRTNGTVSYEDNNVFDGDNNENLDTDVRDGQLENIFQLSGKDEDCWLKIKTEEHFKTMQKLEDQYAKVRKDYQNAVQKDNFDKKLVDAMVKSRGIAERALHEAKGDPHRVPAGINLGGNCMIDLQKSVLFFQRMKLRNCTNFKIESLQSDLENMLLTVDFSLNDLHLLGSYERALTGKTPWDLIYRPTSGEMQLLLKNVGYKVEGRYTLLQDKLRVEHLISEINVKDVLMTYGNPNNDDDMGSGYTRLDKNVIDDYIQRLKVDLNSWIQDYLNDYLILFDLSDAHNNEELRKYDREKRQALNEFVDNVIKVMKKKMTLHNIISVKVPTYNIYCPSGMAIKLKNGVLRGLDTFHRRSIATGKKEGKLRYVDTVIGFSTLKLEYKYSVVVKLGLPPLTGVILLNADELVAHLGLSLLDNPETADLRIEFQYFAAQTALTIEGALNRQIGNIKHILDNHIRSIMTNTVILEVHKLKFLNKCSFDEKLISHVDTGEVFSDEKSEESKTRKSTKTPESMEEENITTNKDNFDTREIDKDNFDTREIDKEEKEVVDEGDMTAAPKRNEDKNKGKLEYGVEREDSIEIEIPEAGRTKKMHILYNETIAMHEVPI